ncbi:MAG: succinate dehydrogenase, cytochrome b556 subunit [Candidatus Omnitrophica bacterium]|nr:succinate dehydrogenase, cytochrome b556 subunit [Candidatus Omnitrophota bacterium]
MSIYRGGIGQWSWTFHRLTGVGVLLFLLVHILDTALIMMGPHWYNKIIRFYRTPLFGLMEIALFAAVLYHALNGVRIIVIDFRPETTVHYKKMFFIQMALFALIFIPVCIIMLGHIAQGLHP